MRTRSNRPTNTSFEVLDQSLKGVRKQLKTIEGTIANMPGNMPNTLTKPSPNIPFKVTEEPEGDGIKAFVSTKIPANCRRLRGLLITKYQNQVMAGESAADALARAQKHLIPFAFDVTAKEASSGLVNRFIGPYHPRKDPLRDEYQLVKLVAKDTSDNTKSENPTIDPTQAVPFTTFIVRTKYDDGTTITNGIDDHFFTISDSAVPGGPSPPDVNLYIVENFANLEAAHATATTRVMVDFADPAGPFAGKTAEDLDIDTCHAVFERVGATKNPNAEQKPIKAGGPIADKTKTFALYDVELALLKQYSWLSNITRNSNGKQETLPATPQLFYAGGTPDLANISAFTISLKKKNTLHTEATVTITQHANDVTHKFASLLKRLVFTLSEASDVVASPSGATISSLGTSVVGTKPCAFTTLAPAGSMITVGADTRLVESVTDDTHLTIDTAFSVALVGSAYTVAAAIEEREINLTVHPEIQAQGKTRVFKRRVKHRADQVLAIGAVLYSLGNPEISMVATAASNSAYPGQPPDPTLTAAGGPLLVPPQGVSDLIVNEMDGDPARRISRSAHRVWTGPDAQAGSGPNKDVTFKDIQAKHVHIRLQKLAADDQSTGAPNPTTAEAATHYKHYGGPIPDADLTKTSTIVLVDKLPTGRKFKWDTNILTEHGTRALSPMTNSVLFYAGFGNPGSFNPSRLLLRSFTIKRINKRHSKLIVKFDQPDPAGNTPPVLIEDVEFYQMLPTETEFDEIHVRHVKSHSNYSSNTSAVGLPSYCTATHKEVRYKTHHPPGVTGIKYYAIIRAAEEDFVCVPNQTVPSIDTHSPAPVSDSNTGQDAPSMPPSTPVSADVILNSIQGDITHGHAKVTSRVYATPMRAATLQGGSGTNGELCFVDVNAFDAFAIYTDVNDSMEKERYKLGGPVGDPDPVTGKPRFFVDIESTVFTAGKQYIWRRNETTNQGHPAKSPIADLVVYAGGSQGTPGLPELTGLSVVLTPVLGANNKPDSRHSVAAVNFTQAATQAGPGTVTSAGNIVNGGGFTTTPGVEAGATLRITSGAQNGQQRTIVMVISNTQLMVDSAFPANIAVGASWTFTPPVVLIKRVKVERTIGANTHEFHSRRLYDDPAIQSAGAKTVNVFVNHPKKTPFTVTATIVADGGNKVTFSSSMTSPDEGAYEDGGAPTGQTGIVKMRWTMKGHLRIRCNVNALIANNMVTHCNTKLLFYFQTGIGNVYLWQPDIRSVVNNFGQPFPLDGSLSLNFANAYLLDISKSGHFSCNNKIPVNASDGTTEVDINNLTPIYAEIANNGGGLFCSLYVFNQFPNAGPPTGQPDGTVTGLLVNTQFLNIQGLGANSGGWSVVDQGPA